VITENNNDVKRLVTVKPIIYMKPRVELASDNHRIP